MNTFLFFTLRISYWLSNQKSPISSESTKPSYRKKKSVCLFFFCGGISQPWLLDLYRICIFVLDFVFALFFLELAGVFFPNSGSTTQNRWNKAYKISVSKTNATGRTFESKQSLSLTQFPKSSSSVALKHFLPVAPHSSLLSPQHLILVTNCLTLSRSSLPHSYLVNQLSCKCI